ncbi:DUF2268 domain-containing putative Zn-dependent protease [Pseudomonas yamanorum]|uniref:DUF2268 domain-containing putative Zn-dependent protease n=1 Tax=Pseudomonas yamanorum TaxID=515393 RepID=UPI0021122F08|nr:DUF2268 domain-containing putative Zn-dependent protease [Pseudomonas yamanorum]
MLASFRSGSLRRHVVHVVHEVHHCLRMAGPGYGWTLGEAMVSEGLAGQFVRRVLGSQPELWERALAPEELLSSPVELQLLQATYYDHSEWFFGTGTRPRWLG